MIDIMTDKERIESVIKHSGMSVRAFGFHIGIKSPQRLYDIIKGKNGISKDLADSITSSYLNVNKGWLLTGEGNMLKGYSENEAIVVADRAVEYVKSTNMLKDSITKDISEDIISESFLNESDTKISADQERAMLISSIKKMTETADRNSRTLAKMVDLLSQKGVDFDSLVDKEKRELKASGSLDENSATDVDRANAG